MDDHVAKLAEYFSKFPGIGSRQAKRLSYFLLSRDTAFVKDFTEAMLTALAHTTQCSQCYRFCSMPKDAQACDICTDPHAIKETLMVVEKDVDLENIRKTGVFGGHFFVLGGTIPILDKNPGGKIRAKELFERVRAGVKNGLKEVIIALSVTPEGEHTTRYITKVLEPLTEHADLKISTLGRGLSTGTELEYSDDDTLKNALKNRG